MLSGNLARTRFGEQRFDRDDDWHSYAKLLNGYGFSITQNYTYLADFVRRLPDSLGVVYALTGDLALTARASFTTKWLRRLPVRRGVVRFLGLPMRKQCSLTGLS